MKFGAVFALLLINSVLGVSGFVDSSRRLIGQQPDAQNEQASARQKRARAAGLKRKKANSEQAKSEKGEAKPKSETEKKPKGPVLALVGAEIRTQSQLGTLESGVVLVQDGKILSVGDNSTEIPDGAKKLDLSGHVLIPGLIDSHSSLWLTSASAASTASNASLNVLDGIDGYSEDWREVLSQGVTTVYVQPASRGTLGGYGAVLSVANVSGSGPKVISERAALQASIGNSASSNRTRNTQLESIKKVLKAAEDYKKKWDEYNKYQEELKKKKAEDAKKKPTEAAKPSDAAAKAAAARAAAISRGRAPGSTGRGPPSPRRGFPPGRRPTGSTSSSTSETKSTAEDKSSSTAKKDDAADEKKKKPPTKPDRDPAKDQLLKVLDGEIPVRMEINTADDYYYAEKLFKEYKNLAVVFEGLENLDSAAESLLSRGNPISVGPWLGLAEDDEDEVDVRDLLSDYSGTLAISSGGGARQTRLLRAHLSAAVASGLSPDLVLKSATIGSAIILGIDEEYGSIADGKVADLVAFNGEPTDLASRVAFTMVGGKILKKPEDSGEASSQTASSAVTDDEDSAEEPNIPAGRFALQGTYLLADGTTEVKTVVIDDGKIESVLDGEAELDDDLELVKISNGIITPGLYSAHSNLGLQSSIDPSTSADASHVVAGEVIPAEFEKAESLAKSGMLRAIFAPGSGNPLAGIASVVRMGATSAASSENAGSKFVLSASARNTNRFPSSLAGQLQMIKKSLNGELLESRLFLPVSVRSRLREVRRESINALTTGKSLSIIEAASDAEIAAALSLIEQFKLKAAILGPSQLEPFVERLADSDVAVIVRPSKVADYDWYAADIAKASNAGVQILFCGESEEEMRMTAALAVNAGMDPAVASAALCYGADSILGNSVWKTGSPADLVVWSSKPSDFSAKPIMVMVDGKDISR